MSTLAARIADALRMHVHPHLSRPIIEEALRKEESAATNYDAGVPGFRDGDNGPLYSCSKCGTTHWMYGPCPPSKDEEKKCSAVLCSHTGCSNIATHTRANWFIGSPRMPICRQHTRFAPDVQPLTQNPLPAPEAR